MPPFAPDEYEGTLAEQTVLSDQYEIVRKLGEGGMGEVHLAKDRRLNDRLVAVKTLPSLRVASKRAMKQLRQEAAAMAELTHEHIVRFFHFGEHERIPYMVMQYIKGKTLDDALEERGMFGVDDLIELMAPIASALDYAHAKGIIHRDIKPANIFIDDDGKPYLADFGVARIAKDTITQVTGRDTTAGTLQYMSPEQCRGEWNLKPASDVYGFATVLYECLSGSAPFRAGPIRDLIINEPPPPLEVDHPIARVIMRGLSKKDEDRPALCAAFLNQARSPIPVTDVPPPTPRANPASGAPTSASKLAHGKRMKNAIGMEFVLINPLDIAPDGFDLGSSEGEADRFDDERQHRVVLSRPYWLGVTPVTHEQYRGVMGHAPLEASLLGLGGHRVDRGDCPAEPLSWKGAMGFVSRLNQNESRRYRLPTEAEWEFACRAGSASRYCFSRGAVEEYAWYQENAGSQVNPVAVLKPNSWGLHDMHGNVWEWCADWYGDYPVGPVTDPTGPNRGEHRVIRGGSWSSNAWICRSASRGRNPPDYAGSGIGFRICLDCNQGLHK